MHQITNSPISPCQSLRKETKDHAEVEDASGGRQAVQEDCDRKVHAQQGVQAPHSDEQDAKPEARAQGYLRHVEGGYRAAATDVAGLRFEKFPVPGFQFPVTNWKLATGHWKLETDKR
jgi:hypothetical protein